MARVALVGSSTAGGGVVLNGSSTVKIDGRPVALVGSSIAPHGKAPHSNSRITSGSSTVFIGGVPVARVGDSTLCGHPVSGGSSVDCG